MFYKFASALACLVALGGVAMADQSAPQQQSLTWEQFKLSCVNPAQFNRQRPPTNIEITCEHTATSWVPDKEGALELPNTRRIAASVLSDKFSVSRQYFEVDVAPSMAYCPRFKEVVQTYATQRAISLEEALLYKDGSLGDVCRAILDEGLALDQALISQQDTGRVVDTCPSPEAHSKK